MKFKQTLWALILGIVSICYSEKASAQTQVIEMNQLIQINVNGTWYAFTVTPPPLVVNGPFSTPPNSIILDLAWAIQNNQTFNGTTYQAGASLAGGFGIVEVPFDGGLGLLLGAGALAGYRRVRRAKKEVAAVA